MLEDVFLLAMKCSKWPTDIVILATSTTKLTLVLYLHARRSESTSNVLRDLLFNNEGESINISRLTALVNNVNNNSNNNNENKHQSSESFIDLDANEEEISSSLEDVLKYIFSNDGVLLRNLLLPEATNLLNIIVRQTVRTAILDNASNRPSFLPSFLPSPPPLRNLQAPFLLPGGKVKVMKVEDFISAVFPKIELREELQLDSLATNKIAGTNEVIKMLVTGSGSGLNSEDVRNLSFLVQRLKILDKLHGGDVFAQNRAIVKTLLDGASSVSGGVGKGGVGAVEMSFNEFVKMLSEEEKLNFEIFLDEAVGEVIQDFEEGAKKL